MSDWLDPGPFLRGIGWRHGEHWVRADPDDRTRLPLDTWERACVPVGMRLDFTAPGPFEVRYRAEERGSVDALRGGTSTWEALRDGRFQARVPAVPSEEEQEVRIEWPGGPGVLYVPEALRPVVLGVRGASPVPPLPRWIVYGDSITEGWSASRPSLAWPAVAGRALGMDPLNMGFAGCGRGELPVAQQIAGLDAALLTVAYGTNCWAGVPHSAPLLYERTRAFLDLVRRGHPDTPLLVVSPLPRPDAEDTPNECGATLAALRRAVEDAVRSRTAPAHGPADTHLALLPGGGLLGAERLADGLHPDDGGHALFADAVRTALRDAGWPEVAGLGG